MKADSDIALERVQSEALGTLLSIQSYRDIDAAYFDRLRNAVIDGVSFFKDQEIIPAELISELTNTCATLRNEATAFPGRTKACLEMANWLDEQCQLLVGS